ncbi:MAG TPA: PilZ domain-containing protein [Deferrisomatales bacterium]|nr:PilZ domain-containing protein [Deferrisomatales bacterium]
MSDHPIPCHRAERRRSHRWRDRRLLTVLDAAGEHPGMTADISPSGLCLALSRCSSRTGDELQCYVAFAQEVVELRGRLTHIQRRPWGVLVGICLSPGQEESRRFLARRYPPSVAPRPALRTAAHHPRGVPL